MLLNRQEGSKLSMSYWVSSLVVFKLIVSIKCGPRGSRDNQVKDKGEKVDAPIYNTLFGGSVMGKIRHEVKWG